jgi:hypothetical protein
MPEANDVFPPRKRPGPLPGYRRLSIDLPATLIDRLEAAADVIHLESSFARLPRGRLDGYIEIAVVEFCNREAEYRKRRASGSEPCPG